MSKKVPSTLSAQTLDSESLPSEAGRSASLPCLSIVAHSDPRRLGERALLTGLLMRLPFELARARGQFAPAHGGEPSVLADPFMSRTPIVLRAGASVDSVRLDIPRGSPLHLDGCPVGGQVRELDARALASGCVLRVSSRTTLLLHRTSQPPSTPLHELVGESDEMRALRAKLLRAAESDGHVLITGETGTGKELVARALHQHSERRRGPFVAVNMATLTESIAPSALFGHVRGAFTGADARHRGVFERAHGGILFLDEIGETPQTVQPMLLRALETGCVAPVGAERDQKPDVRIIAATDAQLEHDVHTGRFRSALFHRLCALSLRVAPLRERRVDIPLLLAHFLALRGVPAADAAPLRAAELERLLCHPFSGNVRELRNLARALAEGESLGAALGAPVRSPNPHDLEPEVARSGHAPPLEEAELLGALRKHDFKPDAAARSLGIPSGTMHYLMERSPSVRRARDLSDAEIVSVVRGCRGDLCEAARQLEVSARALRMAVKQRRLPLDPG